MDERQILTFLRRVAEADDRWPHEVPTWIHRAVEAGVDSLFGSAESLLCKMHDELEGLRTIRVGEGT